MNISCVLQRVACWELMQDWREKVISKLPLLSAQLLYSPESKRVCVWGINPVQGWINWCRRPWAGYQYSVGICWKWNFQRLFWCVLLTCVSPASGARWPILEHYQLLTRLLTASVGSLYLVILWVTMFILENCFIYYERQMSVSLAVGSFWV